jgi:hypothetical protein
MIVREDIQQGTEEWHRIKWGKIGGTRAHSLLVDSETLLDELLAEITEEFDYFEGYQSDAMTRGIFMEEDARQALSIYTGFKFIQVGWLQSETHPLLGISPDAMSEDMTASAEIKCPASKRHVRTCRKNEIPRDNIRQSVHYFTVNPKLEIHWFCSYRPEAMKKIFVKKITRDCLVDIGLKEKAKVPRPDAKGNLKEYVETVPMVRSVQYWVDRALEAAESIEKRIKEEINKLEF